MDAEEKCLHELVMSEEVLISSNVGSETQNWNRRLIRTIKNDILNFKFLLVEIFKCCNLYKNFGFLSLQSGAAVIVVSKLNLT